MKIFIYLALVSAISAAPPATTERPQMKSITLLLATSITAAAAPTIQVGQTLSPIEWIQDGSSHYKGQKETKGMLILGPDQSYFTGRLSCFGKGPANTPSKELNQNKSFAGIGGWNSEAHEIRWHLWIIKPGKLNIKSFLDVGDAGSEISLRLGDQISQHVTTASNGKTSQSWKADFTISKTGHHTLILRGKPKAPTNPKGKKIAKILRLEATGSAVEGSSILRSRWRAGAIHAGQFTSSTMAKSGTPAEVIVMQVRPKLTTHGVYAPVTTPFGYYGSTFSPEGGIGGINFSMWSFGRGKDAPALDQQSRLLAVGSPQAQFSGFSHEGTGVKVRGWNPWKGKKVKIQTLGLRIERGEKTSTFYGYFLDPDTSEWKLYAVGRKPNKGRKPSNGLGVGAFVEVPGRAETQRTGDNPREVHYRGWSRGKDGKWHTFDGMGGPGRTHGNFNKKWGQTKDGWFTMSMGGMAHYEYNKEGGLKLDQPSNQLPPFLKGDAVKPLYQIPSTVAIHPATSLSKTSAEINFRISCEGKGKATLYWGKKDALVSPKHWEKSVSLQNIAKGKHSHKLEGLSPNSEYYYRVLFENEDGGVWSFESGNFTLK